MKKRSEIKKLLTQGELYAITASRYSEKDNVETVRQMLGAGLRIIQHREKEISKRRMFEELKAIKAMTARAGAILIVNDHLDLCLLTGADGVHLGQEDIPAQEARKLLGEDAIIGFSTHNPRQGEEAEVFFVDGIIDYIGVGPIFSTDTKPGAPVAGLDYARFAADNLSAPQVAIGGINEQNISFTLETGVKSVAMIQGLLRTSDPPGKTSRIRSIIKENHRGQTQQSSR